MESANKKKTFTVYLQRKIVFADINIYNKYNTILWTRVVFLISMNITDQRT